jgi:hypothetical protein
LCARLTRSSILGRDRRLVGEIRSSCPEREATAVKGFLSTFLFFTETEFCHSYYILFEFLKKPAVVTAHGFGQDTRAAAFLILPLRFGI